MARAVAGSPATVERVIRLKGGVAGSTHAVDLGAAGWVVLKRHPTPDPGPLEAEYERLAFVSGRVAVTTPEPLAFDAGDWFGRPALVMRRVPGRSHLHGGTTGPWVDRLAATLAALHATSLPAELPEPFTRPHAWQTWRPPDPARLRPTPLTERLIDVARSLQADLARRRPPDVLNHHDFHPGNVTWVRDRVAAVIDWQESKIGPAAAEVAYCRSDLAASHSEEAADRFLAAYRAAAGTDLDDVSRWDAMWTVNAMRWCVHWVDGYHEMGVPTTVDHATLLRRLRAHGDRILATL